LQLQNWISTPKRKNDDFEALFERNLKGESSAPKWKNSAAKASLATFMPLLQYDLRISAAKDNSISHAAAAVRNLDAAIPLRSADTS